MPTVTTPSIDSRACEAEPIRYPGAVQPHGAVLVLDPSTGVIEAASASCASLLGQPAERLLGQAVGDCFGATAQASLLAAVSDTADTAKPILALRVNGALFTAQAHRNQTGQVLVDIEPGDADPAALHQLHATCRRGITALRRLGDVDQVAHGAADLVRALTGFDRVMVYRFDADWNGEVIAEAAIAGIEPYLGLQYPASDIPRQARALFQVSKVRQIPDAAYTPAALLARDGCLAIDLGHSGLRSVSPLHLEYLKNMQVRATLVGSLVVEGRLWGLVSCQHKSKARYIPPCQREALGGLCEDIAELIQERQLRQRRDREASLAQRRRRLIERLREHDFQHIMRDGGGADLLDVVGADGFALVADAKVQTTGHTPSAARIVELCRLRRERDPASSLFATSALNQDLQAADAGDGVAGALFVSVFHKPAIKMIWFRNERGQRIRWGGDPGQAHFADAEGRISPRKSFAQFLQDIRGQAPAWAAEELDSAAEMASMIEIESLREREAFARTILNSIPEHISVLDSRGVIVSVNAAWSRYAQDNEAPGLAASSVGLSYGDICAAAQGSPEADTSAAAWAGIEAVLHGKRASFALEYECNSPTQPRWFRMNVNPMQAPAVGAVVAHEDITEHKQAAAHLDEARSRLEGLAARQARHLRALAKELTHAEQHERDRLHELLHGGVQPLLVAARLSLSALNPRTPAEQGLRVAVEACERISQALEATRTLSLQLMPPLALEQGLKPALESLQRWVKKNHDLDVMLDTESAAEPADAQVRLVCFNAVRELLMNVVKHAGVSHATVRTRAVDAETLAIAVHDTGKGYVRARPAHGTGLAGIARRLNMFGGSMRVDSRPGQGTEVTLSVPSHEIAGHD
jgi:light-regulated signal transduction histidine kinase (bacteriophytochrome)